MAAGSECEDFVQLYELIPPDQFRRILFKWQDQNPKWSVEVVVNYMRNNSTKNCIRSNTLEGWSCYSKEDLLKLVANKRDKMLSPFLMALSNNYKSAYWPLQENLMKTVGGCPCKVAVNSCVVPETIRETLKENMSKDKEEMSKDYRRLVLCSICDKVMNDPVLLSCLHSCCRACITTTPMVFCHRCGRKVKESPHKTNLLVLQQIAVVKRKYLPRECHSDGPQPQGGESSRFGMPMSSYSCKVHRLELTMWCSKCEDFRCDKYVASVCGKEGHTYSDIGDIANGVRKWIMAFLDDGPAADVADNGDIHEDAVDSDLNHEKLFQMCVDVLEKEKQRLSDETARAYVNARETVEKHCESLVKEVKGIREQLNHAKMYARFLLDDRFCIVDQRELLCQQLQLLLFQTGNASVCETLPPYKNLCISVMSELPSKNGKRLFIYCLKDGSDYVSTAQELVGTPQLIATDSPANLIWDGDHFLKREQDNLSFVIDLELKVENLTCDLKATKHQLHETQQTVQRLQLELGDKQNIIDDLKKKTGKSDELVSAGDLMKNMRNTADYVSRRITEGELEIVKSRLQSTGIIVENDIQYIKEQGSSYHRAAYLINDIIIKSDLKSRAERFLRFLQEDARREDLATVMRSGLEPHD